MSISHWLTPPGGWAFKESNKIIIRGESWEELVKYVRLHRLANRIPLGNVEQEVDDQISQLHPQLVLNKVK